MSNFELTPSEDKRFDHLMDADLKTAAEAYEIIAKERTEALGGRALANAVKEPTPNRRYSRRGGRSYPEPSDSETDPFWNGTAPVEPVVETEETRLARERLLEETHQDAIASLERHANLSHIEAVALDKARREIRQRRP